MRLVSRKTFRSAILFLSIVAAPVMASADSLKVTSEQWARIKTTSDFIAIPGLGELVAKLGARDDFMCDIHYAGGENGQFWAQQFRNRLVALGVESDRINMVQGVSAVNTLELKIRGSH